MKKKLSIIYGLMLGSCIYSADTAAVISMKKCPTQLEGSQEFSDSWSELKTKTNLSLPAKRKAFKDDFVNGHSNYQALVLSSAIKNGTKEISFAWGSLVVTMACDPLVMIDNNVICEVIEKLDQSLRSSPLLQDDITSMQIDYKEDTLIIDGSINGNDQKSVMSIKMK